MNDGWNDERLEMAAAALARGGLDQLAKDLRALDRELSPGRPAGPQGGEPRPEGEPSAGPWEVVRAHADGGRWEGSYAILGGHEDPGRRVVLATVWGDARAVPDPRPALANARLMAAALTIPAFREFAAAHLEWEAAVLNDDSPWFDRMPEDLREGFERVQALRNRATGPAGHGDTPGAGR